MFLSLVISFNLSILVLPLWIKKCKKVGLLWEDMNKFNQPKNVAASGGIIVILAFVFGVLSYIAVRTFAINDGVETLQIFSLLSVILILGLIGLTDDLLGNLPDEVIEKFAQSEDFKLYEKVINKYKIK